MDKEETYRELVAMTSDLQWHFFDYVKHRDISEHAKKLSWLRLMGLMETWDII
ncbi:hypothetical protein LCGC14_1494260 [marine sediment metagenome]|uniref:Uncharacterized protein n=1 Tax=marine sediment metagenome TaxID=412755 RepID=A0A0F9J5X3_9ZZZZ